jgi:cation diffusion facilitator CzcD-associated flavoprotein CzcO
MTESPEGPDRQPDHDVVIIGGGFSGIGAAIMLDRAGFSNYLLVEAGDGLGGAWHWNTYPGVAVDIPSFSYQFSFEQHSDWSRVYAPGDELKTYAEHCTDKYDVRRRTRLNTTIVGATFDDDKHLWRLDTKDGDTITTRYVVGATGVLTQPKLPDIDGLDTYTGTVMHTARWDHDVDLTGRRIAIIGTGASAVQAIPKLAAIADHLTVFQRTPIWCLPKPDARMSAVARAALRRIPGARRISRLASQAYVELTFPIAAHYAGVVPVAAAGERMGLSHLRKSVHDPEIRDKLTPTYALGCKRPSFSNEYLETFNRPDVTLVTEGIESVTPTGIRTADGAEHTADTLILATGFKVFEKGNMPPFTVRGANGLDLDKWWDENRFQAFLGVSVPGFPNFFTILGPYGFNGSSYFNLIETQSRHIIRALQKARTEGATRVEVTPEANAEYFEKSLGRRKNQVFFQGRCGNANSYYFDVHGDVPFRPATTLETMWTSRRFPLDAYSFST